MPPLKIQSLVFSIWNNLSIKYFSEKIMAEEDKILTCITEIFTELEEFSTNYKEMKF